MIRRTRMNLFAGLAERPAPKAEAHHTRSFFLGILTFGVSICALTWFNYRAQANATQSALAALQTEWDRQAMDRSPAGISESKPASAGEPKAWTGILWKLSSLTDPKIVFKEIDLGLAGAQAPGGGAPHSNQIVILGSAENMDALQGWVQKVLSRLPGYRFTMDQEARGTEASFPFQFKVTGVPL